MSWRKREEKRMSSKINKIIGPNIRDIQTIIQAGINPKTGMPIKMEDSCDLKAEVKKMLRLIDEQDAVNRYVWYNLPMNLSSQEIERMLYYRGQLCFFYYKELDEFFFMPFAMENGCMDYYGRYTGVHPIPLYASPEDVDDKKKQADLLSEKHLKVKWGVAEDEPSKDELTDSCVLLFDYTRQLAESIIPRQQINDQLLGVMAECIPYMRTSLMLGTGVKGIRVNDADQQQSVADGVATYYDATMTGKPWIPIVGNIEFQDLTDGPVSRSEEYMLAMQSLDNFRLSTYGIDNGGLFEKKAHELQSEADLNGGPVGLVLQDGLSIRQNFCNIVNSIWGLGIWCEPAQNVSGADINGDGLMYDDNQMGQSSGMESGGEEDGQ